MLLFHQNAPVKIRRHVERSFQLVPVMRHRNADAAAQIRRLDNRRIADNLTRHIEVFVLVGEKAVPIEIDAGQRREAKPLERRLHHDLIHPHCAACDAGAGVGNIRQLQQPLQGSILAVHAVHRQHSHIYLRVFLHSAARLLQQYTLCRDGRKKHLVHTLSLEIGLFIKRHAFQRFAGIPYAVACNIDGNDLIFAFIRIFNELRPRDNGNVVLRASPSKKHSQFFHFFLQHSLKLSQPGKRPRLGSYSL